MEIFSALMIGGRSVRMGMDKTLIPKNGTTLGGYLAGLLAKVTGKPPVLVGGGGIGPGFKALERIEDREPGAGPLSGVLGLFDRYPDRDFIVLAADLFAMDEPALRWLLDQARPVDRPAIRPRFPDRSFGEPLASIYRAAAGPLMDRRWQRGVRAIHKALTEKEIAEPVIPHAYRLSFVNVNTPESLEGLRIEIASARKSPKQDP